MTAKEKVEQMTWKEKAQMLTGTESMRTAEIARLNIPARNLSDGPNGVRVENGTGNCTCFPCLTALAASWNTEVAECCGNALADECTNRDIDMLLGPGINIKRNLLCGRNFEYFSEDPVLAGEMGAAYIIGLQKRGVGACLKHFAANNQERDRSSQSMEIDERTLREIYLKAFEIAVKKAHPYGVMCSYNKINAIWCSENRMLLTEILRGEWNYEGMVVSDWGAVQDASRAAAAGLDLQMPLNTQIKEQLEEGIKNKVVSEQEIDMAVGRVAEFACRKKPVKRNYDRQKQHDIARQLAAEGIVLLKNEKKTLPLNRYEEIAVIGEFATKPLIGGQGSAEVYPGEEWIDSPLEELRKDLPDARIRYQEWFRKRAYSPEMLWPKLGEFAEFIRPADVVVVFAGSMESEDTEMFDRRTAELCAQYELFIQSAVDNGKKTVVVLQSGGVILPGRWCSRADAVVEMWLGGEGAGKAVADVLSGHINPSGKLPETFPKKIRTDLDYPGDGVKVEYNEKMDVGYRYYDRHTEEIGYPFGHGLSYTDFVYRNLQAELEADKLTIRFQIENTGTCDGKEVAQVYISNPTSMVTRPVKELKAFQKVTVPKGECRTVEVEIPMQEIGYYNVMLHRWVTEPGVYRIQVGASSQDIRLVANVTYEKMPDYTMSKVNSDMIG